MQKDLQNPYEISDFEQQQWYLQYPPKLARKYSNIVSNSFKLLLSIGNEATHNGNAWTRMAIPNKHAFIEDQVSLHS